MKNGIGNCRRCGNYGSHACPEEKASQEKCCDSFLSWSDLWARETAAIERAQRITYVAALLLVTLATVAILLPKALLG